MIVVLLILILLILLFGAGVVKGWLANLLGVVVGLVLLMALALTLMSIFGEDGFLYILFGIGGLLFVGLLWAKATEPVVGAKKHSPAPPSQEPTPLSPDRPVKKVWLRYAEDIEHRFDLTSQVKAHEIYKAGDAEALEKFCTEAMVRIGTAAGSLGSASPSQRQGVQKTRDR